MTRRTPASHDPELEEDEDGDLPATISVINAHGAFRALLILLTIWTFFEGFALATGALSPVEAGTDRTAERIMGGLMLVLGGVYAVIAWQRERYRLLLWVPFAAQLAIVVPLLFDLNQDSTLLLVISTIFLVLLVYVWWRSRDLPLSTDEDDEEWEEDDSDDEEPSPPSAAPDSTTRARDSTRRSFRRREP